jgi:hypothetical protein
MTTTAKTVRALAALDRLYWADPTADEGRLTAEQEAEIDALHEILGPHAEALGLSLDYEIDETWGYAVAHLVADVSRWRVEVDERHAAQALALVAAGPGLADPVLHSILEGICTGMATARDVRAFLAGVVARKRCEPIEHYRPVCEWSQAGWDEADAALAAPRHLDRQSRQE